MVHSAVAEVPPGVLEPTWSRRDSPRDQEGSPWSSGGSPWSSRGSPWSIWGSSWSYGGSTLGLVVIGSSCYHMGSPWGQRGFLWNHRDSSWSHRSSPFIHGGSYSILQAHPEAVEALPVVANVCGSTWDHRELSWRLTGLPWTGSHLNPAGGRPDLTDFQNRKICRVAGLRIKEKNRGLERNTKKNLRHPPLQIHLYSMYRKSAKIL
jgi:hypothetical protein